jgi:LysM repeat protein
MVARNVGRYLAPIALIVAIVATFLVVSSGLSTSAGTSTSHHSTAAHRSVHTAATVHATPPKVFYVVQSGDSLSTISVKTGVSVPTLETLNPSVNPNALQTGQRLRLRQ